MIGLKAISAYLPDDFIDNVQQGERFGESRDFITNKIGALKLPRRADSEETSDLAVAAVRALFEQSTLTENDVDALVLVTQNGDGSGLPHTAASVQSKLSLTNNVAAFDLGLACSGYVYGLSVLKGLMHEAGLKNGVLVTADPYSKVIDPDDRVTSLLFGDAATATWLCEDAIWDIGVPLMATDGEGGVHLMVQDGRLQMNGRQVFNFAAVRVPKQIKELLEKEQLGEDDVDLYCIHQGSASIVDAVSRRFPAARERFVLDMASTGNTVSSSIPLLLRKHLDDENVSKILISGFGVGLSWASSILTKRI